MVNGCHFDKVIWEEALAPDNSQDAQCGELYAKLRGEPCPTNAQGEVYDEFYQHAVPEEYVMRLRLPPAGEHLRCSDVRDLRRQLDAGTRYDIGTRTPFSDELIQQIREHRVAKCFAILQDLPGFVIYSDTGESRPFELWGFELGPLPIRCGTRLYSIQFQGALGERALITRLDDETKGGEVREMPATWGANKKRGAAEVEVLSAPTEVAPVDETEWHSVLCHYYLQGAGQYIKGILQDSARPDDQTLEEAPVREGNQIRVEFAPRVDAATLNPFYAQLRSLDVVRAPHVELSFHLPTVVPVPASAPKPALASGTGFDCDPLARAYIDKMRRRGGSDSRTTTAATTDEPCKGRCMCGRKQREASPTHHFR